MTMAKDKNQEQEGAENKSLAQEYFEDKAEKSAESRSRGGKDVTISLTSKIKVRFNKDFGQMKKGHEQYLSEAAYEIYNSKGVVDKL